MDSKAQEQRERIKERNLTRRQEVVQAALDAGRLLPDHHELAAKVASEVGNAVAQSTLGITAAVSQTPSVADQLLNFFSPTAACSFQGAACDTQAFCRSLLASVMEVSAGILTDSLAIATEPLGLTLHKAEGQEPMLRFTILLRVTGTMVAGTTQVPFQWASVLQEHPTTQSWLIAQSEFRSGASVVPVAPAPVAAAAATAGPGVPG